MFNFTKIKHIAWIFSAERKLHSGTILVSGLRIFDYENVSRTYRNASTTYSVMIVFYLQDTYKLFKFYLIYGKVVDKLGNLSYYLLNFF